MWPWQPHNGLAQLWLSSSPLDREEIVRAGAPFCSPTIVDPSGLTRSGRLWAGGERDTLRRSQAHSRYRVLSISPVLRRPLDGK